MEIDGNQHFEVVILLGPWLFKGRGPKVSTDFWSNVYQESPNIHFFGINLFEPHWSCQIGMLEVVSSNDPAASNWRKPVSTCNDARLSCKEIETSLVLLGKSKDYCDHAILMNCVFTRNHVLTNMTCVRYESIYLNRLTNAGFVNDLTDTKYAS